MPSFSFREDPHREQHRKDHRERLARRAEASRAARLAGHKSLVRRLLEHVLRQPKEPGNSSRP
jgi:hypothetical protein